MLVIKILALMGAWLFFYNILRSKNKRIPGVKATVITLLFATLIFRLTIDIYATMDRAVFSFNEEGKVHLIASPLKIPANQGLNYCKQFTDQNKRVIQKISVRKDGQYCGEFWKFESDNDLLLPYKILNANQVQYWASPSLQIIGSKESLEKIVNLERK